MDTVRYYAALILLISMPPGLILWLFIHPFATLWRKLGPVWTYTILGLPMVVLGYNIFLARDFLLAGDFGTSTLTIVLAFLAMIGALVIGLKRKKHLTFGILSGLPELSEKRYPGKLLKEGIYGKIRHPRYIEALLGVLAYAFFSNYLATYIVFLFGLPMIYIIVLLEERELLDRFGDEYKAYSQSVPRFLPKLH
ncbi:MAG: methyltransferase family protein [bacterium]